MGAMRTLQTVEISKSYSGRRVVDNVTVRVEQGEVVGLLGPNGAGKTTSFYILSGLVSPDSGDVLLDDRRDHAAADVSARAARHQLSAAGAVGFPQAQRGRQPDGDSADAAAPGRERRERMKSDRRSGPGDGAPQ